MYQVKAPIVFNRKVNRYHYLLRVRTPDICGSCLPGQFVLVQPDRWSTFLRRPFSIYSINRLNLDILYKVVGKGTEIMKHKRVGDYIDVIGPLGNGFSIVKGEVALVGGGCGVAPLFFLGHRVKNRKGSTAILGAKNRESLLCVKEFRDLGFRVEISTEDGSYGTRGKATDLLKRLLKENKDKRYRVIYSSGPREMLKSVFEIARRSRISCQVSLEENMACGVGACMGCVVKSKDDSNAKPYIFKRVCKDGPVFDASQIVWD